MDLDLPFGADLSVSATGDLRCVSDASLVQQRVLRRLLTNAGDYLWHPEYGAGLAQFVGQPGRTEQIRATIRSQIFKEDSVARSPEPVIDVSADRQGGVFVEIQYADADTGTTRILSFAVNI